MRGGRKDVRQSNDVSVIIPTYNYADFIGPAIRSALEQTDPPAEIIVVDDGSSDDTEERVKEFRGVTYVRKERGGVSSARNLGIEQASGVYLAFLDADDQWENNKLEQQLRKFHDDPELGLVHCGMFELDEATGKMAGLMVDGREGWIADELILYERPIIIGPGSTAVVRRAVIEDVGGFDERLTHGEDWEFCVRVAKKYKIGFVPKPLVNYRAHASNAHLNVSEMERSTLVAWSKNFENGAFRGLRRRSYGNLHRILAASFYHDGQYVAFLRNAIKGFWYRPSCVIDFMLARLRGNR